MIWSCSQFVLLGSPTHLFIGTRRGSGIDNLAHVGGFVTGALVGVLCAPQAGAVVGEDDGAILPPWVVRGSLAAMVAVYGLGLREAVRIALRVIRSYGRL